LVLVLSFAVFIAAAVVHQLLLPNGIG
jgi:hypothetical protein